MKRTIVGIIVSVFLVVSTAAVASAGRGYYGHGWSHHYSSYSHHRHYSSHYRGGEVWAGIGLGLLTGALVTAIVTSPRPRTVVYTSTPSVVVRQQPVIVRQQFVENMPVYDSTEVVLRQVRVTPERLNLRTGPGVESGVVGELSGGTVVGVVGAAPDWLYIKTENGQYGWIMTRFTDYDRVVAPVG